MPTKTAIVAVHGVRKTPRYAFSDLLASNLLRRLNAATPAPGGVWREDILLSNVGAPPPAAPGSAIAYRPNATRLHQSEPDPDHPVNDVYDIHEAFWSPLDKGKTNAPKVALWLLSSILVPLNSTARYEAPQIKIESELVFICGAMLLALLSSLGAVYAAARGLAELLRTNCAPEVQCEHVNSLWSVFGIVVDPRMFSKLLDPSASIAVMEGALAAYLLVQSLRALWSLVRHFGAFTKSVQIVSRAVVIVLMLAFAAGLEHFAAPILGGGGWWFIAGAGALEAALWLGSDFFVDFFGDVQIYTNQDENAEFYNLRSAILERVEQTIVDVIASGQYDRVHIFAHSLGSTIALDALMRIFVLMKRGIVSPDQWSSIRSFVTFGTALEKTRYLFSVLDATFTSSGDQWADNVYGKLFTPDFSVLAHQNGAGNGIFWSNYCYWQDPIGNPIESYRSYIKPTDLIGRASAIRAALAAAPSSGDPYRVAVNHMHNTWLFKSDAAGGFVHGQYLCDDWFWYGNRPGGALEILMSRGELPARQEDESHQIVLKGRIDDHSGFTAWHWDRKR